MLPDFPKKTKLVLDDKHTYKELVAKYPPVSDFNFATIMIWWNIYKDLELSVLNNNIVLFITNPLKDGARELSFIGTHEVDKSLKEIFEYCENHNMKKRIHIVPQVTIDAIESAGNFIIYEDLDSHEYLLSTALLGELKDPSMSRIRRKVNKFNSEYSKNAEIKNLDLSSYDNKQLLVNSFNKWARTSLAKNDPAHREKLAINTSIAYAEELEIKARCVYIDGVLAAFALYQITHDTQYAIIHHLKVDYGYPNLFDFLTHQLAIYLKEQGVMYMNYEMDLGIPGLRFHKQGLRPVSFFKKYVIEPAA